MQQPQVRTPAGTFEGFWADDAQSIQVFKGIAYASPPVGPLRFKPPAPKPSCRALPSLKPIPRRAGRRIPKTHLFGLEASSLEAKIACT